MGSSRFCSYRVGDDADGQVRPWTLGSVSLDYDQLPYPSPASVLRVLRPSTSRLSWHFPVAVACPRAYVRIVQRLDGCGFRTLRSGLPLLCLSLPECQNSEEQFDRWPSTRSLRGTAGVGRRNNRSDCTWCWVSLEGWTARSLVVSNPGTTGITPFHNREYSR